MIKTTPHDEAVHSELGKPSLYDTPYNPDTLFPIARILKRDEIGVITPLPFFGFDLWNHYEVSWLNAKGKPEVAVAEISYACDTPNIIESKSMKLYFNSLNNTKFANLSVLTKTIQKDISERIGGQVDIKIKTLPFETNDILHASFNGICLDQLDIVCEQYSVDSLLLFTEDETQVEETLYSNLLKSNCLVTNQPDWASIQISYQGKKINHEGLLRYLVSFRNHNEFHEQCIERIFMDILRTCQPQLLTVYGRYTRRGGIDINPYRSTQKSFYPTNYNLRLYRQ